MFNNFKNFAQSVASSAFFKLWSFFVWPFQAPTYIVLFGAPGSGKGTLATELAKYLKVEHLSTGEVFRRETRKKTSIGQLVSLWMKEGALAPDDVTFSVLARELCSWKFRRGAILDGFPRNVVQAQLLNALLTEYGAKIKLVVALDVPEEELTKRLLARGRPDDISEVIAKRLKVNREETAPLLPYYESNARVLHVALPAGSTKADVLNFVEAALS
jgi:adenylate kinase